MHKMETLVLNSENIFCHLRQTRMNKEYLQIVEILDNAERQSCICKAQQYRILEELLHLLPSQTDITDGAVILSCIILLTTLQEQEKLPCLNENQFVDLWQWLMKEYKKREHIKEDVCRILIAIGNCFALHPGICDKYFVEALQLINKNISFDSLQILNKVLSSLRDIDLNTEQLEACNEAGSKLLHLHYSTALPETDGLNGSLIILNTLQILHKTVALSNNFAKQHTSELLGMAKTYFHFGLEASESPLLKPQKVNISQQAFYDSAEEIETVINSEKVRNCGGKTPKTRKPRTVTDSSTRLLTFDIKTSDSDFSEPESARNLILYKRNRNAKVRMSSISLVGLIARTLERKVLFGYWHALFPSGTANTKDNLLYLAQHDPNVRCRSTALQVCTHLIYGSKGYLHQAEINTKSCPSTFIPFSISLGHTLVAIYKSLTCIVATESSLPVLTQALKCLAVLVQASPFKQFEKGFVQNFVKAVMPLVYHRNAAVQVSALMVMEFLLALPELTDDITDAIGLPQVSVRSLNKSVTNTGHEELDIVDIEEYSEEDYEKEQSFQEYIFNFSSKEEKEETSWLLQRVLNNLCQHNKTETTSVRIASLQVLIVMSSHFALIKPQLTKVGEVLCFSLKDPLPDVRLYAARCIDACAYQISRYFMDETCYTDAETEQCCTFWLNMLPFIMDHIRRDSEEMTCVRITLCDALSNIGALMYEKTPHPGQISLLSFLSGVSSDTSDDTLVRSAGARALAVFALYPSLRGDLVFIENTAELTLRLVKDPNLLVRIKSYWSLGNISDALVGPGKDLTPMSYERLSDDLLFRLISAATEACSDNDKVRCNAVRTLGNLLRLLNEDHFNSTNSKLSWPQAFERSIKKLSDCLRSSGNAKVKWNTCYAITNLMRNPTVFKVKDLKWQETLFTALCHVIVHHSNFKVRINASAAITNITERSYFGNYYEKFWSAVLEAIEQSYNLDNFHEYNHRDSLQEQLCLALAHIIQLALNDDLLMLQKHLMPRAEIIRNTWQRVINRMVPEKAAPLIACPLVLAERGKNSTLLTLEQKKIIEFLLKIFSTELF